MEWIIKFVGEDYKNHRLHIEYIPYEERIIITGQYRIKTDWHSFTDKGLNAVEPNIEDIRKTMEEVVVVMRRRIEQYENLNKGFGVWKEIEFKETKD